MFFKVYNRLEVIGSENVPLTGGVIIASNHVSYLDPPAIGVALKRKATYMAREGLLKIPILGTFIKEYSLPVRRDKPQPSIIKEAVKRLKKGAVLVIFPEGSRSIGGSMLDAKRGISVIISLSKVYVVPTFIKGTEKALPVGSIFPKPAKITIVFGRPIEHDRHKEENDKQFQERISREIMEAIKNLKFKMDWIPCSKNTGYPISLIP